MWKKSNNLRTMLLFALIMLCIPFTSVLAASKLNLYYYGSKQNVTYTGQQVKYTLNGSDINMRNTPGIIMNGVSLASYKDVFIKSAIKADYEYNKPKKTVTLSYNGTTIVYTLDSTKALVNGKAVTAPIAPIKVKFKDQNVTKILVPARFTAETLGCSYVWNSSTSTASITKPLSLYYNGKNVTYTSTQGQVMVDGKTVNLGTMPSIIVDNTAMLRAKKVFKSSSIDADYNYNKSTKELTLTKGDTVVKLTMNSPIVYVNDKARVMDTSPIIAKNMDTGISYIMVPGSFVSSYLGYDYAWNSSSKTSNITSRTPEDESDDSIVEDGPELGADPVEEVEAFNWGFTDAYINEYTRIKDLVNTTEVVSGFESIAYINSISNSFVPDEGKEVYTIYANAPITSATVSLDNNLLKVHVNKSSILDNIYYLGGKLVDSTITKYNQEDGSSDIVFNLLKPNLKYELTIGQDKQSLVLTLYKNILTNVKAGSINGQDYIKLTSMSELSVNVSQYDDLIAIQLNDIVNGVGELANETYMLNSLQSVQLINLGNNTTNLILQKSPTADYYVTQTGNTYTITFFEEVVENPNLAYDLQIKLPSEVDYNSVENVDRYYKNQIAILIPGDYRGFYKSNPLNSTNKVIKDISVSYKSGYTEIVLTTTKLQGYKLVENKGYIGVTIGNPRDIYKNIVVLDAGHGGTDPGAIRKLNGVTINEKDVNFSILYNRAQKYFNAPDSKIKVYYSRYNDTKVDLYERAAFATKVGADLFVSLHMNANNNTSIRGTEVYYYNTVVSKSGLTSKSLANLFLNYLPGKVGTQKRNIRRANYVVVRETKVPAILVELAFMSNPKDLALMTDASFQEKSAKALYDTLCKVFEAYPTGR